MKYSLFAFDLDGTFLRSDKSVPEVNLRALREARSRGAELAVATGRCFAFLPPELLALPELRWYITSNGAALYDRVAGCTVCRREIDNPQVLRLLRAAENMNTLIYCYVDDRGITLRQAQDKECQLPRARRVIDAAMSCGGSYVEDLAAWFRESGKSAQNITLFFESAEEQQRMARYFSAEFPALHVSLSVLHSIDINASTKAEALADLCALLGIEASGTVAFGDNLNDASMLSFAGLGVAMANSEKGLFPYADMTAPSNDEGGVGLVMEKLLQ